MQRSFDDPGWRAITNDPNLVVTKHVTSAFYGEPNLHGWLQSSRIHRLVIAGITTNHCCETTARMAGNLGYETFFALDATHTFDRRSPAAGLSADELTEATATNLDGEFASIVNTREVLAG